MNKCTSASKRQLLLLAKVKRYKGVMDVINELNKYDVNVLKMIISRGLTK